MIAGWHKTKSAADYGVRQDSWAYVRTVTADAGVPVWRSAYGLDAGSIDGRVVTDRGTVVPTQSRPRYWETQRYEVTLRDDKTTRKGHQRLRVRALPYMSTCVLGFVCVRASVRVWRKCSRMRKWRQASIRAYLLNRNVTQQNEGHSTNCTRYSLLLQLNPRLEKELKSNSLLSS